MGEYMQNKHNVHMKCVEITETQTFKPSNRTYIFTQNNLIEQSPQSKGWITDGLLYDAS